MLLVKFGKTPHQIPIDGPGSLYDYISRYFSTELNDPKLIYKGKKLNLLDPVDDHLNVPLLLLTSTSKQVSVIAKNDQQYQTASQNYQKMLLRSHKEQIVAFCDRLEALNYPDKDKALELLDKIRNDYAIRQIMKKRNWKVAKLKELDPSEHTILGYNKNKGEEIALRLRTDDYKGFRIYSSIRQVMLHELAHMVHQEHNNEFNELNSLLNKEYDSMNRGMTVSRDKFYQPKVNTQGKKLGGKASDKDQRELAAEAALKRKEVEEMNKQCGT